MYRKLLGLVLISMGAGSLVVADVRKAADRAASPFDWPQWQGPDRTAISHETGLLKKWPKDGPKLVWKAEELGGGYSAPAIAAGRIFGLSFRGQDEVVWALDEKTGKETVENAHRRSQAGARPAGSGGIAWHAQRRWRCALCSR